MKKIGSVIKIEDNDLKIKIGTIDKKNPSVIFLEGGCYIKPIINKDNYKEDIETINNLLKSTLKEELKENNYFKKDFMLFIDVADDWIKYNKKSFFSFQIFLKTSDKLLNEKKNFGNIVSYLSEYNTHTINFIKETINNCGYEFYKKKI